MAYGLNIVPTHGYFVEVEAVDGDVSAIRAVDQSKDGGISWKGARAGRHVHPASVPTTMKWLDRNRNPIPDFNDNLLLNVSLGARDIIEQMEPKVHQFLPVSYVGIDGTPLEERFFLFVGNRIDGISREATTMVLSYGMWVPASDLVRNREPLPAGADPDAVPKLVFSRSAIEPFHLWRDKHLSAGPFISDELAHRLLEAGLTGLRLGDGVEVD